MTKLSIQRNQRGFTLVEIAIILTIVGLVIGGIWLAASTVTNNMKKGDLSKDVVQIVQNVKNLYANQSSFSGLDVASAIKAGVIPANLLNAARDAARHGYNGAITLGTANTGGGADSGFFVTLAALPQDACIELISGRFAQNQESATRIGFFSVAKGATAGTTAVAAPVTPAAASTTYCDVTTTAGNTITVAFSK